jgi:hypothetical protein
VVFWEIHKICCSSPLTYYDLQHCQHHPATASPIFTNTRSTPKIKKTPKSNHQCRIWTNCITAVMRIRISPDKKKNLDFCASRRKFLGHRDISFKKMGQSREKRDEWEVSLIYFLNNITYLQYRCYFYVSFYPVNLLLAMTFKKHFTFPYKISLWKKKILGSKLVNLRTWFK